MVGYVGSDRACARPFSCASLFLHHPLHASCFETCCDEHVRGLGWLDGRLLNGRRATRAMRTVDGLGDDAPTSKCYCLSLLGIHILYICTSKSFQVMTMTNAKQFYSFLCLAVFVQVRHVAREHVTRYMLIRPATVITAGGGWCPRGQASKGCPHCGQRTNQWAR
jgi:hypothetical protein